MVLRIAKIFVSCRLIFAFAMMMGLSVQAQISCLSVVGKPSVQVRILKSQKPGQLARGDQVHVTLEDGHDFPNAYYLGFRYIESSKHLVFISFNSYGREMMSVPNSQIQGNEKIFTRKDELLIEPSFQCNTGNCMAHAAASFVMLNSESATFLLTTDNGRAFLNYRQNLVEDFTKLFYPSGARSDDSQSVAVVRELERRSLKVGQFVLNSNESRQQLFQLLKQRQPVILVYESEWSSFRSPLKSYLKNGALETTFDSKAGSSEPRFTDRRTERYHAVLALGVIETPNESPRVLILDSATGSLQFWYWSEFERNYPSAVSVIYKQSHTAPWPLEVQNSIRSVHSSVGPKVQEWLQANSKNILNMDKRETWAQRLKPGNWVLLRKNYSASKSHWDLLLAQVHRISNESITFQELSFGELKRNPDSSPLTQTWSLSLLSEIRWIRDPEFREMDSASWNQILTNSPVGAAIQFERRSSPNAEIERVEALVVKNENSELTVYDPTRELSLTLKSGDLIRNLQTIKKGMDPSLLDKLLAKVAWDRFADLYYGQYASRIALPENSNLKLAFSFPTDTKFDTERIKVGSRLAVNLNGFVFEKATYLKVEKTVAFVKVSDLTDSSMTVSLENNFKKMTLKPAMVQELLLIE